MLIVEAGESLATSNSYAARSTADNYFQARNVEAWSDSSVVEREAALIRATDYIDHAYVFRYVRRSPDQALENPRTNSTVVDPRVVKATIELALIALSVDLFALEETRRVSSEEISGPGGLGKKTSYALRTPEDPYPHVTRILAGYASRRGAASRGATAVRPEY